MKTIHLALGSNMNDRYVYMTQAIKLLSEHIFNIYKSSIYETKPWGVENQNTFLNMVIKGETNLSPTELLNFTQQTQDKVGRIKRYENGPREIDIDILLYANENIETKDLTIPHKRLAERDFVLVPLLEVDNSFAQFVDVVKNLKEKFIIKKYIPTQNVYILNLSPESFTEEYYSDLPTILNKVKEAIDQGADYIDIGAQSTKPNALQISEEEEIKRIKGVIKTIKNIHDVKISIDTTRASCAQIAIDEGADMVNDVSGGRFDPDMIPLIAKNSHITYIVTHSRGNFKEMHQSNTYTDIIQDIQEYFKERITTMLSAGILSKQIILDPGIGYSKSGNINFEIIKRLEELKNLGYPLYIGLSRKKFIGVAINEAEKYEGRDIGGTVLHTLCIQKGVDYIRTHNVNFLDCTKKMLENL